NIPKKGPLETEGLFSFRHFPVGQIRPGIPIGNPIPIHPCSLGVCDPCFCLQQQKLQWME
ncbi:MAG: hypothetical protein ABW085_14465, partial [Sedimenticola sp.]